MGAGRRLDRRVNNKKQKQKKKETKTEREERGEIRVKSLPTE